MYFKRRFFIQLVIFGVSIPRGTPEASRQRHLQRPNKLHSKYIIKERRKKYFEISTLYECVEKLSLIIGIIFE